nr:hypothetical protein [uncultured Flavobacterium sp.]
MSQPVGIIAKINISEDNYKKFLRKEAVSVMSQEIFESITEDGKDIFVFKYIKKENALYSFSYFHYGDRNFILSHPILSLFKNITSYLDDESKGYLIATRDSLNCSPDDFAYCASIQEKKWEEKPLTEEEIKSFGKDADKLFFKNVDADMAFILPKIVDKSIVKKVAQLQEHQRIKNLKNNLHTATLENPIQLFKGYFYNGQQFYHCSQLDGMIAFSEIDLQQLRQTVYGLCDDRGVIIGNKYIKTDPSKFKKWQKHEAVFYSSAERVYNESLEPYPNSDGASYKMISEHVGEDKNHIYFVGKQLLKTDIGLYKINDSGYFYRNILLYSKTKVYAGENLLPDIDASSFEIISPTAQGFCDENGLRDLARAGSGCFMLHCKDKDGEFIIHNYDTQKTLPIVERITVLAEYIAHTKQLLLSKKQEQKRHYYPDYKSGTEEIYYNDMNHWLATDFDKKYNDWQYNMSFLITMNNYFYSCFQLYNKNGNKDYLNTGAAVFEKIAKTCFINPYIFHNTACIYAALGNEEKALQSVSAAFYYGYQEIELIWKDKDLKLLFNNKDFKALKESYEIYKASYPFINTYLLDKIDGITESYYKNEFAGLILKRLQIPDFDWFISEISIVPTLEDKAYYEKMVEKTDLFINDVLQQKINFTFKETYEIYREYKFLNARTHFKWLSYFFAQAHSEYPFNNISYCKPIAEKIKNLLQQHKEDPDTKTLIQEIKENEINKVFRLVE